MSAPDTGFGILAISNPRQNLCLCTWMDTAEQAMPLAPQPPEWMRKMVLLEVMPAYRQYMADLATGDVLLRAVQCSNLLIFTGLRRLNDQHTLVAISLSNQEENATLTIQSDQVNILPFRLILFDALTGEAPPLLGYHQTPQSLELSLKPFQILFGRW